MFYKYLHYKSDDDFESLINGTLINPTLMFVAPETLNDPNEFKFAFSIDLSNKDRIRKRFFSESANPSEESFQAYLSSLENDNSVWWIKQQIRTGLMQNLNLISLSKTHKSNLLWCHYTDVGKGFCIIYKNELIKYLWENKLITTYGTVNYLNTPPVINFPEDDFRTMLYKIIYSKEHCWNYEKEVRITVENSTDQKCFIKIPNNQIFGIIIGAKMDNNKVEKIIGISKQLNYKYFYASELGNGYNISISLGKDNVIPMRQYIK